MQPAADELMLFEYGTCSDPEKDAKLFERRHSLQPYLGKWLTPFFDGKQLCLRASHYVGLLPFSDEGGTHLLMIAPKGCRQDWKYGLRRFLELIALGEDKKDRDETPPVPPGWEGQKGPHLFLLFLAHHYAGLLQELCRRDFRSYYRPEEDELRSHIRGRLDLSRYARLAVGGKAHILPCRWDEFTVDNWDNRILWAAARRLKEVAGALASQAAELVWQPFKRLLPWFSGVAEIPITTHDLHKSRLWRTSRYYRRALAWAELLIQGSEGPVSGGQAPPLVLDANRTFEQFAGTVARAAVSNTTWSLHFHQETAFLHANQTKQSHVPDILLTNKSCRMRAVGDAKYKQVLEQRTDEMVDTGEKALEVCISSNDWNQLYVYVGITKASFGFFIVPFWDKNGELDYWKPDFQFAIPPREGKVHLAVLGLNLLKPLKEVQKQAARRLRSWLDTGSASL
jgi:hypothetical protein